MPEAIFGVSGPRGRLYVRLYRTTNQSLSNGSLTPVEFDEISGSRRFVGKTTGAVTYSRVYAPRTGLYAVAGGAQFAADSTGTRSVSIRRDGAIIYGNSETTPSASVTSPLLVSGYPYLKRGQYLELAIVQSSGGDLNTISTGTTTKYFPYLEVVYLGDR